MFYFKQVIRISENILPEIGVLGMSLGEIKVRQFCLGHFPVAEMNIIEIKICVYGKRERQKLPRDHDFPAIFHVCRLPF